MTKYHAHSQVGAFKEAIFISMIPSKFDILDDNCDAPMPICSIELHTAQASNLIVDASPHRGRQPMAFSPR